MTASSPRRPPSLGGGLALSVASVVLCLLLGEAALRIRDPRASLWAYPNYIREAWPADPGDPQLRYDRELGWEPIPGFSGLLLGQPISFSAEGLREHNLGRPQAPGPPIFVLGDSYVEGYGVGNDETWPAYLERDTGRRVLNAGLRSYGLDQAILRAERLAPIVKPRTFILAFIGDDIARTALSVRETKAKPYFVVEGAGLALRNVPVPASSPWSPASSPWSPASMARDILGYSFLLDYAMRRLDAHELWYGDMVGTGMDGDLVACRLMERFAALVRRHAAKALVVGLPEYDTTDPLADGILHGRVTAALSCAAKAGLATLDTYPGFGRAGVSGDIAGFYKNQHLSARGNALAARLIAAALGPPDG